MKTVGLFYAILLTQIVLYLEAGAIPCLLDELSAAMKMTAAQQGALGGIVYLALSVASPFCGYLFQHFDAKAVLATSLFANNAFVLLFALSPTKNEYATQILIAARALIGLTQSFVSIYSPLWVDAYAPRDKLTGWMSYLQGSVPLGVILGYSLSVLTIGFKGNDGFCGPIMCWRWPFLIQFIALLPLMFGILFVKPQRLQLSHATVALPETQQILTNRKCHSENELQDFLVDDRTTSLNMQSTTHVILEENVEDERIVWRSNTLATDFSISQKSAVRASYIVPRVRWDSFNMEDSFEVESTLDSKYGSNLLLERTNSEYDVDWSNDMSAVDSIKALLQNRVYTCLILGLSSLYFVVTGIQYWGTIYMIKTLHAPRYLVNTLFLVVAGTGPILGVFFGGHIVDTYGGYKGIHQRAKALQICMYLGMVALVMAVATTYVYNVYLTAFSLWLVLFFGASILPACTGIFVSSVPRIHRPFASAVSVMLFNLLGYSLSPYLTGIVMNTILSRRHVKGSYFEFCDEACAYRYGFRFCLCSCIWSFIFLLAAYLHARQSSFQKRRSEMSPILE